MWLGHYTENNYYRHTHKKILVFYVKIKSDILLYASNHSAWEDEGRKWRIWACKKINKVLANRIQDYVLKNHTPRPTLLHFREVRMVQHSQITAMQHIVELTDESYCLNR